MRFINSCQLQIIKQTPNILLSTISAYGIEYLFIQTLAIQTIIQVENFARL